VAAKKGRAKARAPAPPKREAGKHWVRIAQGPAAPEPVRRGRITEFRRCGFVFARQPRAVELTAEQAARIEADAMLQFVEPPSAEPAADGGETPAEE